MENNEDTLITSELEINQTQETELEPTQEESDIVTFKDLGLDEYALQAVEKKGFEIPSPIQVLAIPRLLTGDTNLIAKARTGTGKTAAFGLPIIQNIHEKCENVQALILEPTRELAMQTCTEFQSFTQGAYPRTTVLYGGASYSTQIKDLKRGCEIVVGTPGRVKDHIEKKTLDLSKIKYFILDEGDEMLDMGFIEDIEEIFKHANPDCRILLFSATMPSPILKIASEFMGEYEIIEEEGIIDEPLLIDQKYWVVKESDKIEALVRIIDMSPDFYGLVFTQTKMDADNVTKMLDLRGYSAAALHGDIMQNQREKVLERFRMKKTRILVATDVAARGIDITGLSHVVNYSLPFDGATYVHRIGRTGRAGSTGIAVTLVRPEERRKLGFLQSAIAKASKGKMTEEKIPTIHDVLEIKQQRIIKTLQETLFTITSQQVQQEEFATSIPTEQDELSEISESTEQITQETSEVQTIETKTPIEVSEFFANMAQDLCKEQDAQKVLAAVLATVYGEQLSPKHYGRISVQKDFGKQDDMSRIYVQLGKKDGLRPKDIAEFFSNMLHIPGRQVDQIDMAREFTLVSLPKASARKAIEMSKSNKKIPHMHYDVKDGMSRRQKAEDSKQRRKNSSEKKNVSDFVKNKDSNKKYESRKESRSKGNRPNVHVQTEQRKGAAKYKKSSKAERF